MNRVLRGIFGPKKEEVRGKWRKLHNEELIDLCRAENIFRVIKSRRMNRLGHEARTGERRSTYMLLVGKRDRNNNWKTRA